MWCEQQRGGKEAGWDGGDGECGCGGGGGGRKWGRLLTCTYVDVRVRTYAYVLPYLSVPVAREKEERKSYLCEAFLGGGGGEGGGGGGACTFVGGGVRA